MLKILRGVVGMISLAVGVNPKVTLGIGRAVWIAAVPPIDHFAVFGFVAMKTEF
jgi:hypothetical protein